MTPDEIAEKTLDQMRVSSACCICGNPDITWAVPVHRRGGFGQLHGCGEHPLDLHLEQVQQIAQELQRKDLRGG